MEPRRPKGTRRRQADRTLRFGVLSKNTAVQRRDSHDRSLGETHGVERILQRLQIEEHPQRADRSAAVVTNGVPEHHIAHTLAGDHRHERAVAARNYVGGPLHRVERGFAAIDRRDLLAAGRRQFQAQDRRATLHRTRKHSARPGGIQRSDGRNAREPSSQVIQLANIAIDERGNGLRKDFRLLGEFVAPLAEAQPAGPDYGNEQRDEQQDNREKQLATERNPREASHRITES